MVQQLQEDFISRGKTFYISAKYGEELLRRTGLYCDKKSHIICPLILDWWNMKKNIILTVLKCVILEDSEMMLPLLKK